MNPATSFPVTTDSVTGPSMSQHWDPATMCSWGADSYSTTPYSPSYSWDANSSPTTLSTYYPYSIPPTDYSTNVQTFDPSIYSSAPDYTNFNAPQDHTFYNYYDNYDHSTTIPSGSSSLLPTPSSTPPAPIAPAKPTSTKIPKVKSTAKGTRKCSNCFTTNSCRWKNIRTKSNILCNTCYVHKQRTGEDRSAKAIIAHQAMQMQLNK